MMITTFGTPKNLTICLQNAAKEVEIKLGRKLHDEELKIIFLHIEELVLNAFCGAYVLTDERTQSHMDEAFKRFKRNVTTLDPHQFCLGA